MSEQKEFNFPVEFFEVFILLCHLRVLPCFGVGWGHVRSDGKLRMLFLEGAGMRCACSSVYRKDSTLLINNRLSLQPSWHSTGSVCECQSVVWLTMTERNPTNSCWNRPAVRCYRMLFMSGSWWWTSEELWDVFIEVRSCMQGEALSRSMGSQLSARSSCSVWGWRCRDWLSGDGDVQCPATPSVTVTSVSVLCSYFVLIHTEGEYFIQQIKMKQIGRKYWTLLPTSCV